MSNQDETLYDTLPEKGRNKVLCQSCANAYIAKVQKANRKALWTRWFLLFVGIFALTSWLLIGWAQSRMPIVHTETLTTENMGEYRKFQRDCLEKTDVVLTITIYHGNVRVWRLTCNWQEQP